MRGATHEFRQFMSLRPSLPRNAIADGAKWFAATGAAAGATTGRLLILKKGAVAVLKEGVEIAKVMEPGAVFGELSVLLDQPHTADVRALEASQFHVADAATLLKVDPIALLYVATVLARRLDNADQALIELRHQVQAGQPRSVIEKTVEKMEGLLGASR